MPFGSCAAAWPFTFEGAFQQQQEETRRERAVIPILEAIATSSAICRSQGSVSDSTIPCMQQFQRLCDSVSLEMLNGVYEHTATTDGERTWHSHSPLMSAAHHGHLLAVRLLLSRGCLVNVTNHAGWTALSMACRSGCLEIAELLVQHGARDVIANDGTHAVWLAAAHGHSRLVEWLLTRQDARTEHVHLKDALSGRDALGEVIRPLPSRPYRSSDFTIVTTLVAHGATLPLDLMASVPSLPSPVTIVSKCNSAQSNNEPASVLAAIQCGLDIRAARIWGSLCICLPRELVSVMGSYQS